MRMLAARLWAVRRLTAAADLTRAIDLGERALADALTSRNNLAGAYASAARVGEAIPLYGRTLADRERVLGADHPDTLTSRDNLSRARSRGVKNEHWFRWLRGGRNNRQT
jgi:hypothetical protein